MSNHKALLRHATNYLIANIATKALLFISIPVYTKLLNTEEYGIINVFISTIYVVAVLLTLNSEVAIGRFYFDAKNINEFKRFVGTSINLSGCIIIVSSIIFLIFINKISKLLSFNKILTLSILPVALYSIISSIFEQIYNPMMQSKKIAIVSSVKTYLAFCLSIVFILLLKNDKYMGYVWGTIVAMLLLSIYLYKQIRPYYICCIEKRYLKYIINYCLPYLPYSLSGVILAQFGRIFLSNESGFERTGIYSFASNISMIMLVIISIIHQAWNPFYFRYMNEDNKKNINTDYDLIWRITLIIGIGICIFGREIGCLIGGAEYQKSMHILPLLVTGYVFYQWAYVYMRNTGYAKRTIWNGVVVVAGGISNILLSYFLIPSYQELGVAIVFCISYFVIMCLSYIVNKFIIKKYAPDFAMFNRLFLLYCIIMVITCILNIIGVVFYMIFFKIILFLIVVAVFMWKFKADIKRGIFNLKQ